MPVHSTYLTQSDIDVYVSYLCNSVYNALAAGDRFYTIATKNMVHTSVSRNMLNKLKKNGSVLLENTNLLHVLDTYSSIVDISSKDCGISPIFWSLPDESEAIKLHPAIVDMITEIKCDLAKDQFVSVVPWFSDRKFTILYDLNMLNPDINVKYQLDSTMVSTHCPEMDLTPEEESTVILNEIDAFVTGLKEFTTRGLIFAYDYSLSKNELVKYSDNVSWFKTMHHVFTPITKNKYKQTMQFMKAITEAPRGYANLINTPMGKFIYDISHEVELDIAADCLLKTEGENKNRGKH